MWCVEVRLHSRTHFLGTKAPSLFRLLGLSIQGGHGREVLLDDAIIALLGVLVQWINLVFPGDFLSAKLIKFGDQALNEGGKNSRALKFIMKKLTKLKWTRKLIFS